MTNLFYIMRHFNSEDVSGLPNKILFIDDEVKLLEVVKDYLTSEGYDVYLSKTGQDGLNLFSEVHPDFVILDLMLPDFSGEEICNQIRLVSDVPILMLTAKSSEDAKINGLALGADDYLTKPFSIRELVMRVKAILRRTKGVMKHSDVLTYNDGDLEIFKDEHVVKKNGIAINITPNEYKLLLVLAENPNKTFSRNQLINAALGYDFIGYDRTIDTHIKNLRQKIEDNIKEPRYISTVYGIGYKFRGE